MTAPLAYTRDEAAEALRISKAKVDEAIRRGDLKAVTFGRDVRIPVKALAEYLETRPAA
jgi:excisionase family DNA binding protein